MIKIDGTILASKLASIVIYEIERKTNQDFVNQIMKNEKLLESIVVIFEKALQEFAERMNQEPIGKSHNELTKIQNET